MKTQKETLLGYLETGGAATHKWATNVGIGHLNAVIRDIRNDGHSVVKVKNPLGPDSAWMMAPFAVDSSTRMPPASEMPLFGGGPHGWSYFVRSDRTGRIKIGWTTQDDPKKYVQGNKTWRDDSAHTYLGAIPGTRDRDTALKRRFSGLRSDRIDPQVGTEWHEPGDALMQFLAEIGII